MSEINETISLIEIENERYDLRILQSLRKIIRLIDLHSRKLSSEYDITTPQLITLYAIIDHGPLTIAAISKHVHLSASTLVGVVDRLEAKEYITRQRSKSDRRQVLIDIANKGKKFLKKAPSPLQETLANSLKELNNLEQATISFSLERVANLMEKSEEKQKEIDASPILQIGDIEEKNLEK